MLFTFTGGEREQFLAVRASGAEAANTCFVTWRCVSAHLFTFLAINRAPRRKKKPKNDRRCPPLRKDLSQRGTEPGLFFFYSSINQHGLNTPLTMKSKEVLAPAKRFSPNFLLFFSSACFLSSSAPFRIFQCFTVGTNCLPCCLPAPVISATCFYRASAVQLRTQQTSRASMAQICAAIKDLESWGGARRVHEVL